MQSANPTPEVRPARRTRARPAAAMTYPKQCWLGRRLRQRVAPGGATEGLSPAERRALRAIVEAADLVERNGRTFLVAAVTPKTVDALAAFEAERAELEDGADDEPSIGWLLWQDRRVELSLEARAGDDREADRCDDEPDSDAEQDYFAGGLGHE